MGAQFFKVFSKTLEKHNRFQSPAVASSGNDSCFWLTDRRGNLILLDKQSTEIYPPSRFGVVRRVPRITCMLLDLDGRSVWVGYKAYNDEVGGIVHFDGDTVKKLVNSITKLTTYLKDRDDKVFGEYNELFVDKSGMVWTHTGSGIARFDRISWQLFDSEAVS